MKFVRYSDQHNFIHVYRWCLENCVGRFYTGTDWNTDRWKSGEENRMVQFENERDATAFALVWL